MTRVLLILVLCAAGWLTSCQRQKPTTDLVRGETFAELRTIKAGVRVTLPGQNARRPYPRERLSDGEIVEVKPGGLAWMRRDGGATWLISGPAKFAFRARSVELTRGRVFVDGEQGAPVSIETPRGKLELSDARASVEVEPKSVEVYVLRGTARAAGKERAGSGERLSLLDSGKVKREPVISWTDWTGGLGTADPAASAAPFGIGTVGARKPGEKGKPRFGLVIQRMDVNVTIDRDFALTEVDQTFVNPSSDTVEGIFSFRTPLGAVLQRFGVDRDGELSWGRVKETGAAIRQYESNVYQASSEDPALLTWRAAGEYNARLYPIRPGAKRRVVTRYTEWLSRQGTRGERRIYVYPMAAEGATASLPRIEELTVTLDLSRAGARRVLCGMGGKQEGDKVIVKAFDFVPRADLAIELFDDGQPFVRGYRAPHGLTSDDAPEQAEEGFAERVSESEADYVAIPLRAPALAADAGGVDLAIVVDTSAATEPSALSIARSMAGSLLAHLGPEDRAALWAGDASLKPVAPGSGKLAKLEPSTRLKWLEGLASIERGGATDLGSLLTEAAEKLDPKRSGAVIYIGDGAPSVGELAPDSLRQRVRRLPKTTRVLAAAVGSQPNLALLESLTRGAPVEQVHDAYGAARSSLRLLEAAGRPLWLAASVDLGPNVERVLPKQLPPISADQTLVVVGRISGVQPTKLVLTGSGGVSEQRLSIQPLNDAGDLRRRWGEQRLEELMASGAGRASLVDLGRRFGLVSPFTAWYVPTQRETEQAEAEAGKKFSLFDERLRPLRWQPWSRRHSLWQEALGDAETSFASADGMEGGTGTRAKGEEGSLGKAQSTPSNKRYAVRGPQDSDDPSLARERALREAEQFGMIGRFGVASEPAPTAPAPARDDAPMDRKPLPEEEAKAEPPAFGSMWGDEVVEAYGAGGIGLGSAAGLGHGGGGKVASVGSGAGFGGGHGRLGGSQRASAPRVRMGATTVSGKLPKEVVQRIVRQNFGRYRLCYEQGLARNPNLVGRVSVRFVIGRDGSVSNVANAGSDLADAGVVTCMVRAFYGLSFPAPEAGIVTVVYPIMLSPPEKPANLAAKPESARVAGGAGAAEPIGTIGHQRLPCGVGADLPLDERRILWHERSATADSAVQALVVYRYAVLHCEATNWRERSLLLVQLVNRLENVRDRVELWRSLLAISPSAADAVFRLMLLRVQNSADLRSLHDALGFERIQPELLDELLAKASTPAERLRVLRGAAERFPEDTELALSLLEAYEDAGDDAGGRAWARKLRRRVDATSHLRTSVAEYYLRLGERATGRAAERDAEEARRSFGEIVEFAPEDPLARRRLGDLLRAHGFYAEALRQYQTLETLTPDDPSVPLLLAAASQGMGKTEEALRWLEKAAGTAAPDSGSSVALAARALGSAFLAWARQGSSSRGKSDELERLRARAARMASVASGSGVRVILTWSHPELRVALWTNALGSVMPAPDNLPLLGVAQAFVPEVPAPVVEIRADPEDAARAARLGAQATLTVIVNEGRPDERIVTRDVHFEASENVADRLRFSFNDGALSQEAVL